MTKLVLELVYRWQPKEEIAGQTAKEEQATEASEDLDSELSMVVCCVK